jgi:cbb3-type cytochrome oxidase subunit 3
MRSHCGARRDAHDSLAGWWPAPECIAAPAPVDRHRTVSMAFTLVALTLLFLALAMFGPAQRGSAEQATAGAGALADPAAVTVVVEPAVATAGQGEVPGAVDQKVLDSASAAREATRLAPEATCWARLTMSGTQ